MEGREHRRLVSSLVRRMQASGLTVQAAECPGWPRPPTIGRRRPDVVALYRAGGAVVAGEAKRGPDLRRSHSQLSELAEALSGRGPRGAGALLILAVPLGWEAEAFDVCADLPRSRTMTTVWSLPR